MIRFHAAVVDLLVDADKIHPDPRNANRGDTDAIIESIITNGCYRPVYVAADTGTIVAGHHLYDALLELGAPRIPVQYVDGDTAQARRILIADNRIAALATMDEPLLLDLLDYLQRETEAGLVGTGYSDDDLTDLREHVANAANSGWALGPSTPDPITVTCPKCGHLFVSEGSP